jgi:hypothetical protein
MDCAVTALLLVLALFAGWWLFGLAALALVRANTAELRVALTAPIIGSCAMALVVFLFSEAGVAVQDSAVPVVSAILAASLVVLVVRRPRVHAAVLLTLAVCVGGLFLTAWPMLKLGFGWLANGNEDMANYVLSAQQLLTHGLLASPNFRGLAHGRDYATVLAGLHLIGGRPGADLLLATVSRVVGRPPYEVFMPLILAFSLSGACAVGALAMQFARRWWAGVLAAGLLLVSPLATYAVLQELLAQVWGLGIASALFALLMRPELHTGSGARARQIVPIGILATGLVLGYIELVPEVGLAYVLYLVILGARRRLTIPALARLWVPALAIALVVLNKYLFTEIAYLSHQSKVGLHNPAGPPLFGFILVPSGLPGVVGVQTLPPGVAAPWLNLTILLAAAIIVGALLASAIGAWRGISAASVLLVEAGLAVLLAAKSNDFGLFKLSMYAQPFLAAVIAVWFTEASRKWIQGLAIVSLAALVAAQVSTQRVYVNASRNSVDAPNVSSSGVIPAFRSFVANGPGPVVSVTENPVLIKLEAAAAEGRQVYFQSRNAFLGLQSSYASEVGGRLRAEVERAVHSGPWALRTFDLRTMPGRTNSFEEDTSASSSLASGLCRLVLPTTTEVPFNRYSLPASAPDLVAMPCGSARDLLAFTTSALGESFYLPTDRRHVSFYQFQADPYFAGGRMVGFGRYALFEVLGPTRGARIALELTDTLNHDGANALPPAAVVGASRASLRLQGRGSARVFSPPVTPQMIGGRPYVLVDMGADGRLPVMRRHGVQGLYGRAVPTDPRFLTSYVRDISFIGAAQYAALRPPSSLQRFPGDLSNPALEYSGLYEDGWMGAHAFARLAGGPAGDLVVQGAIPAGAGRHLQLLVNGRQVASVMTPPGILNVKAAVPASRTSRVLELRFGATIKLHAPDLRPAAAHLAFLGVVPRQH